MCVFRVPTSRVHELFLYNYVDGLLEAVGEEGVVLGADSEDVGSDGLGKRGCIVVRA